MRTDYSYLLICLACGGSACASDRSRGADRPAETTRDAQSAEKVLGLAFDPMYSAYDGDYHSFRVPVRVSGAEGELEVSTSPPDFVDAKPSPEGVILTTRQAGSATVTITDGAGRRGSARLIVTENDPHDVELGMERYRHPLDGPCVFCHVPIGSSAPPNVTQIDGEYTPQQTAGLSDDELARIFTEGEKPEGAQFRVASGEGRLSDEMASEVFRRFHSFALTPETSRGLVAYLRQLAPRSRGELDFGGLYPGRSE